MTNRVIIQARMLSTRLRAKSLMGLKGFPLLMWVIANAKKFKYVDDIFVATTLQPADDPIETFARAQGVNVFRGSTHDVLGRFAEACEDLKESDNIIRITADNPLVHFDVAKRMSKSHAHSNADYTFIHNLSHVVPEFIKVGALREADKLARTQFDREHVTPFLRSHRKYFKVHELDSNFYSLKGILDEHFTIDTIDQFHEMEEMLREVGGEPGADIVPKCYSFLEGISKAFNSGRNRKVVYLDNIPVGEDYPTYIIAEIGQNHNGETEIAKSLIDLAVECGASAVKFQKRDIASELTTEAYNRPYDNPNSFGKTYGKHREYLELNEEEHRELKEYATMRDITYFVTPCDIPSVDMMERLDVPFYKVASRDLTNIPLLERLRETNKAVIISTGMADIEDIDNALEALGRERNDIIIMQCTSQYPAALENINLKGMYSLKERYGKMVGLSDHHNGIITSVAASVMGAVAIEKHITRSRAMKGSDHAGSIEKSGLLKLVNYIRASEKAMGTGELGFNPVVQSTKDKLARSLTSKVRIRKGELLSEDNLTLKSPGTGIKWADRGLIIKKKAKYDIPADTTLSQADFE